MIKDLKSLKAVLKACREQGVSEISLEGCTIKFGDMPPDRIVTAEQEPSESNEELTGDNLIFYSVEGAQ